MRVVLGWLAIVAVSLGLGVTLYATSLQGSTTGVPGSVIPPRPVPTVVERSAKAVHKSAKTKEAPRVAGSIQSPSRRDPQSQQQRYRVDDQPARYE